VIHNDTRSTKYILKKSIILVTSFYTVHAGLVPEREGQMATEHQSAGERSAGRCTGQREQHYRRRTPLGGLSLRYPGRQQQLASLRRRSPSPPPRPNHADPRLRRPVLATPFTVLSTIQFLQTTPPSPRCTWRELIVYIRNAV
jgi:hypothetical protein